MDYNKKMMIVIFGIMPLCVLTIRFVPEIILNLNIDNTINDIIMIGLIIKIASICVKWTDK